ncbi:hypothetical protein OG381_26605 [Streptomyces sp. NBC_00490]|uniref:hypothetical protein n=1 Tax=Streptomyces sp. NBC_00490 TaxID=2903657 RepID=UPI002E18003A
MADEWLSREHEEFALGLSRFLDLDAGLHEVREQAGRHEDVVRGLGLVVDAEGGLASILHAEDATDPATTDPANRAWMSEADVAEALRALPAEQRLAARKDPAIAACVSGELLVRALELLDDLVQEKKRPGTAEDYPAPYAERFADLALDYARARRFTLAEPPALTLPAALNLAAVFARTFEHDLRAARHPGDSAHALTDTLDSAARARDPDRVRGIDLVARPLARSLALEAGHRLRLPTADGLVAALLDGTLDDFTDADLTGVNPNDPGLNGIQWSDPGTRWPPGTDIEALRNRSEETSPYSRVYVLGRRPKGTSRPGAGVRV